MSANRVVVLAGGLSYEREVSLRSGRRVIEALRHAGVEAIQLDADGQLLNRLTEIAPDAVFVALHGSAGEDGALRDVLDLLGVPFVGSTAAACRLAWDKPCAKSAMETAGILTPPSVVLPHSTFRELGAAAVLDRLVARLGLPLMVKPTQGGSALGAHAVERAEDLPAAMVSCFGYGNTALVERLIRGTEVAVSVIETDTGIQALPAVEVVATDGVNDYRARYTAGMSTWHAPARVPDDVAEELSKVALRVHEVLGLRDLSRIDAIVDPEGRIYVLEANVAPGMTETSLLPLAVEAAKLDLARLCRDLLEQAAARGSAPPLPPASPRLRPSPSPFSSLREPEIAAETAVSDESQMSSEPGRHAQENLDGAEESGAEPIPSPEP
ncbi:MAG: D-alanine--D-alanine ligase [Mycobacteriales bacterium]